MIGIAMDAFGALRDFLSGGAEIIIYGAGRYSNLIVKYILRKGYSIKSIVISDSEKIHGESLCGIPIRHISDINEDAKIVLALSSKYHQEVLPVLLKQYPKESVLCLPDIFFDHTLRFLLLLPIGQKSLFRKKAEAICKRYNKVEFCLTMMQCFGLSMFFVVKQKLEDMSDDTLRIFIPDFYNWVDGIDLEKENPGNPYFYSRLKEEYSFIDLENADFWGFFIDNFPENVSFSYDWMWEGMENFQQRHWNEGSLANSIPYFNLSNEEKETGRGKAASAGITKPYICFNARSDRYFAVKGINNQRTKAQSDMRNCSVEKFRKMCDRVNEYGINAVRMGALNEGSINGKNVIDYSRYPRDPFMDYYLISESEFVVCQYSGFHYMAVLFNKPTVITDAINLTIKGDIADIVNPHQDIMLLKKIYSPELGRCITFKEMLAVEEKYPDLYVRTNYYAENSYEFIENSDEEVAEAALEMLRRLDGKQEYDDEYYSLQKKVSNMREKTARAIGSFFWNIPLAEYYIKNNKWLLED